MSREMKDSGIAWVGKIPSNWRVERGKNILQKLDRPVQEDDGVITCFRDGEVTLRSNRREDGFTVSFQEAGYQGIEPGDLVVHGMDGFAGAIGISDSRGKATPVLNVLESKQNKEYIMYYLRNMAHTGVFLSLSTGIRVRSCDTNWNKLKTLPYILPSIAEQNKIARFLKEKCDEIDSVLSSTCDSIEEYKKLRRAVISQAVTRGVRKSRKMKACCNGWVMDIPEDWTEIPSKFLFRNSDTRRMDSDEQLTASQKYGIISQKEYMSRENSRIVLADKGLENWKHVEPYDYIISLRSFQGGLEMSEVAGCITWHYIVLKPCKKIYSKYFKWLFKSELYIKALQRTCNFIRDGQDLRYSNFVQVPLFEPPIEEQKEIADYLDRTCSEIDTLIAKKEQYLVELENYKKSLIYEYVTGKKEVR